MKIAAKANIQSIVKTSLLLMLCSLILNSCTKHTSTKNTPSTTTSGGSGATPLGTGGSTGSGTGGSTGSGTGGSTGSGTGGSTGSGTGGSTGSGTGGSNTPQTYLQGFNYSNFANSKIYANDSIPLLANGYYTSLTAGSTKFGLVWGNHNSNTLATYFLNPYSFYSYFVFDETPTTLAETILNNGSISTPSNVAQVRFINIDPSTKTNPLTIKLDNGNDKLTIPNRTYLDNKTDSTLAAFVNINPSTATVLFMMNNTTLKAFNQYFQGGKKYTIVAAYSHQYSYSTYYVAQHN